MTIREWILKLLKQNIEKKRDVLNDNKNDIEKGKILKNLNIYEKIYFKYLETLNLLNDPEILQDKELVSEINLELLNQQDNIINIFKNEYFNVDSDNFFLEIRSGTGGLDAQEWGNMLFKMYLKYLEKHKIKHEVVDFYLENNKLLKYAIIRIEFNYKYLMGEVGAHRLVRISPFNSLAKRQTSFASVHVYKEVSEKINITIDEKDLMIDTFRSSGAGGQHVNKTESAIRIKHIPSGITVSCQSQRSQHQNRALALVLLKAKLYDLNIRDKKNDAYITDKESGTWSKHFRSYILDPRKIVNDNRLDIEINSNVEVDNILNGDLDIFIEKYFWHYLFEITN